MPPGKHEHTESKDHTPLLVLGLSRTGALSRALAVLGYENLYDLDDIACGGPEHADFWLNAAQRKLSGESSFSLEEVNHILDGYDGVRNVPSAAFATELIRHYPSSKVILPTRNVDGWHVSCMQTVYQRSIDPVLRFLAIFHSGSNIYATLLRNLQQILYKDDFPNYGKTAFHEHREYIHQKVPPELLLEFSVEQGWEPLCKFLEKEIPLDEFPRSNGRDVFWKGCRTRDIKIVKGLAVKGLLIAVCTTGLVVAAWSYRDLIQGLIG
ncbi:nad dependent epimerase protein [Arthroderma uncinatum]|uniref:nad dependent epimerase protein n=1 Tax=Arthroderma uncinatum TaxID=74035 RepID=UPI00144A795C|nr:nad dependent epimerase protein [Arthroderma uncinatum]KAF3483850.1 nad dependent epimerase protein [Arthroderma uncinatum]